VRLGLVPEWRVVGVEAASELVEAPANPAG
jgi:hypothetical protein